MCHGAFFVIVDPHVADGRWFFLLSYFLRSTWTDHTSGLRRIFVSVRNTFRRGTPKPYTGTEAAVIAIERRDKDWLNAIFYCCVSRAGLYYTTGTIVCVLHNERRNPEEPWNTATRNATTRIVRSRKRLPQWLTMKILRKHRRAEVSTRNGVEIESDSYVKRRLPAATIRRIPK